MSETDEELEDLPIDEEEEEEGEEEEEEEVEEEEDEDEHWSVYNSQSFISGPFRSENCTIQGDILQFHFSFGYNCRKLFNLTVPDPDTILFASGNFINFFNVPSKTISFRRSALGGGIGHIKANPHPEFNHVAVAENGNVPLIIIYEWPTMDILCVLKGGSSRLYSHLDFSPDGTYLVSQGGEPDYLITIWNWQKRRILLRTKSYVNDVCRVKFSPFVPGQLTTCGISHIKFWKMATTFTGLKLKGDLGRFGKTEFSDILGVLPMPDEKVVSGCAWGNILVWDAGLIKLEVFRTLRRKCHEGPIVQLSYNDGELMTVAMDGHVKIWWYEKIDQADPPDDDRVIQIEPTYDFYTPGLMLMCIRKRYPDSKDCSFFAQDGNGGIWIIDLNSEQTPKPSIQLYKCHAGKVVSLAACPWGPFFASLGEDGRVYVYNYLDKTMIFDYQFPAKGTCMIWLPPKLVPSGDEIVMGFDDGTIRISVLIITEEYDDLFVVEWKKPHSKPITAITINPTNEVLVSGSEDSTIFLFKIVVKDHVVLVPIGYINVPNAVTCFTWNYFKDDVLLVGCLHGEIVELQVKKEPQHYTKVSYLLKIESKVNKFKSYKAQIRRNIKLAEIQARKDKKVARKRVEMEKLKKENPGLDIDEEVFLADSETEEELEPLYIPEVPNRILWMQSTKDDTIWLSMGGYDAGYIYEYKIDQKSEEPTFFRMVDDADDVEISSYIYNYNKKYLIFAMQDGEIRVNKIIDENFRDLSDYWSIPMHDNQNGFIPSMCFSYDETFFFTGGYDGNVFSYTFKPENDDYLPETDYPVISERISVPLVIEDHPNYDKLSIEQASLKEEQDRIDELAARNREVYRQKLRKLRERFFKLLRRNSSLLPSQVIASERLEVDHRVTAYLHQKFDEEMALVKRKLAFDVQKSELKMTKLKEYYIDDLVFNPIIVTGLQQPIEIKMLRENKLTPLYEEMLKIVEQKVLEDELKGRPLERPAAPPKAIKVKKTKESGPEYFLLNLSPSIFDMTGNSKFLRLLQKYRNRKLKWEKREEMWEEFNAKKPVHGVNHPDDDAALALAQITIGDYKLKSDSSFRASKEQRENTVKKYKEVLLAREQQYLIRYNFNKKVLAMREEKQRIRKQLEDLRNKLEEIHKEIPENLRKECSTVSPSPQSEFPELDFEITVTLELEDQSKSKTKPIFIVPQPRDLDQRESQVLPKNTKKFDANDTEDIAQLDFETLCNVSKNEKKDTAWEADLKSRRLERKLFEQDEIILLIDKTIKNFDEKLDALCTEKFTVDVDAKLMDVFNVTLQQELNILREFEALENTLQEKVNQKNVEVLDMHDVIEDIKNQMVIANNDIEKAQENIKTMQVTFTQAILDNKFFEFLRKVYKKKYKPPKVVREGSSSESSSSSSSDSSTEEEDDGKSIDSRDFGIIKQDLNVCPHGCEQATYDFTVSLRTERHKIELEIKDTYKNLEIFKKQIEMQNKKVVLIEKELAKCQNELEAFQREKQYRLNEVRCTVVLKFHQLQHLTPDNKMSGIMRTLVFSKTKLSQLYKRVEELQDETELQIRKHHQNVRHFARMTTDCAFMSKQLKSLQEEIADTMKIKFGKMIDINEVEEAMLKRSFGKDDLHDLEEVILKKIVHDMRLSSMDIKGMYLVELQNWKDEIIETRKELTFALRYNTSQQELLSFLVKEKTELEQTLISQGKKKQQLMGVEGVLKTYNDEIGKLEAIVDEQNQKIQELKDEIKLLRTKGMVLQPKPLKKEQAEEEEEVTNVWEHMKVFEEVPEEEETARKPFSTEIIIPTTLGERSQEVATELINELLQTLEVRLSKKSQQNLIKDILASLMRGVSMADLVQDLVKNLPLKPSEEQLGVIEETAEQLYVVGEPEETPEYEEYGLKQIIEEILQEALATVGDPQAVVTQILAKLLDQISIEVLTEDSSLELIDEKLSELNLKGQLSRQNLLRMVRTKEAQKLLEGILQDVFDTGVDLLYYIKDH